MVRCREKSEVSIFHLYDGSHFSLTFWSSSSARRFSMFLALASSVTRFCAAVCRRFLPISLNFHQQQQFHKKTRAKFGSILDEVPSSQINYSFISVVMLSSLYLPPTFEKGLTDRRTEYFYLTLLTSTGVSARCGFLFFIKTLGNFGKWLKLFFFDNLFLTVIVLD